MKFLKERKLTSGGEESWVAGPLGLSLNFGLSFLCDLLTLCFLALASTTEMLILEIPLN